MCPQVRDPSKRVQPAWRGGRAGGPQHRGHGALDEAGAGAWTPSARGSVQAELPATKLSSVCGAGCNHLGRTQGVQTQLAHLGGPAKARPPGPPDPASGIASWISSVLMHRSLGSGSRVTVRGC